MNKILAENNGNPRVSLVGIETFNNDPLTVSIKKSGEIKEKCNFNSAF